MSAYKEFSGKTVEEAKMALKRNPFEPKATPQYLFQHYLDDNESWRKFIGDWAGLAAPSVPNAH